MHFNLAIGMVLSTALFSTTYGAPAEKSTSQVLTSKDGSLVPLAAQTHVVCQAGLSDTNICENTFCACAGNSIFCLSGTTCLSTCVCAA